MAQESRHSADEPAGVPAAQEASEVQHRLEVLHHAARVFAHDVRNPLSAVLLGVQRLARFAGADRQAQAHELATRLESSIHSMAGLVEGLADLARHQGGALHLETSRHPAAELVTRAVDALRAGAAERRQRLELELATDLPEVEWDADRVLRMLQHLLARALQAASEGGTVRCSAVLAGGQVVLTVEGAASRAGGTGEPVLASAEANGGRRARDLGVVIARALAEAHGGSLQVQETVGRASVSRLALPLSAIAAR
jgi:signal transduction histidine kinase